MVLWYNIIFLEKYSFISLTYSLPLIIINCSKIVNFITENKLIPFNLTAKGEKGNCNV